MDWFLEEVERVGIEVPSNSILFVGLFKRVVVDPVE